MTVRTHAESLDPCRTRALRSAARDRRHHRRRSSMEDGSSDSDDEGELEDLTVGFDVVKVRDYPIRMGDNPFCSAGPPLTLAWHPTCEYHYEFDIFEGSRAGSRRVKEEMALPSDLRFQILETEGYSMRDICESAQEIMRVKKSMEKNRRKGGGAEMIEERVQTSLRSVKRMFGGDRRKAKEEKDLLKRARMASTNNVIAKAG